MTKFGQRAGYRSSKDHRYGLTCARQFFCQGCQAPEGYGVDQAAHMLQAAQHSQRTAEKYYRNNNAYRMRVPANAFQNMVDQDFVRQLISETEMTPAIDHPDFFKPNWPKQLDPLPLPIQFIKEQSKKPVLYAVCPRQGCNVSSLYVGDLMKHRQDSHSKDDVYDCCCGFEAKNWIKFRNHIKSFGPSPFGQALVQKLSCGIMQHPPKGLAYYICSGCHRWWPTKRGVTRHIQEVCGNEKKGGDATVTALDILYSDSLLPPRLTSKGYVMPPPYSNKAKEQKEAIQKHDDVIDLVSD